MLCFALLYLDNFWHQMAFSMNVTCCYDVAKNATATSFSIQYTISQLRFVHSNLHLVTYLDEGNFSNESTERTLHEISLQVFLRFSDSSKSGQSVLLFYKFVWLAGFRKSEENLLKTSWKVVPVIKVAHIFWWRHDNRKQSASAPGHWCDVNCDIPYWPPRREIICHFLFLSANGRWPTPIWIPGWYFT